MSESPSAVARYVTKMRHMAQKHADDPDVADCLWSGAALLELVEHQHRQLFEMIGSPPRIVRYSMTPDDVLDPGAAGSYVAR